MKKFKSLLSFLLCFALVFSIFPGVSYAGLVNEGNGKAQLEMVLLKEDTSSTDGSGFTALTNEEIKNLKQDSTFFIGFKMKNFNNIAEMADGLGSCVFRIDYLEKYLECEPTIASAMDGIFYTILNNKLTTRMANSDLWTPDDYTGKIQMTASTARKQESTRGDGWLTTTYATAYSLLDSGFFSSYKGATDEYLLVTEFKVLKNPPSEGINALYYTALGDSSAANEGFTMNLKTGSYQNNGTDNTESNNISLVLDYTTKTGQSALWPTAGPADPAITGTVKIQKGGSDLTNAPVYGDELTASVTDLNAGKTAKYQWYRGDTAIDGETNATYTVAKEDIGNTITVKVTADGTTGEIASGATSAAERKALTNITAAQLNDLSLSTSTGTETQTGTFSAFTVADNGVLAADITDGKFTGGSASYTATFANYNTAGNTTASVAFEEQNVGDCYKLAAVTVPGVTATVADQPMTGSVAIEGNAIYGETLTAKATGLPDGSTLTWYDGAGTQLGTGESLKLTKNMIGKTIVVKASKSGYSGTVDSSATAAVAAKTVNFTASNNDVKTALEAAGLVAGKPTTITMDVADKETGDTVNWTATVTPANAGNQTLSLTFTLDGADKASYIAGTGTTVQVTCNVEENKNPLTSVTAASMTTTYTYGENGKLDLDSFKATGEYEDGTNTTEATYQEALAAGYKIYVDGAVFDVDTPLTVTAHNGKTVTLQKDGEAAINIGTLTVNKATPTIKWGNLSQTAGSVTAVTADLVPADEPSKATVKYEVITTAHKDATETEAEVAEVKDFYEFNESVTVEGETTTVEAYLKALPANSNVKVKATFAGGNNTNALATDAEETLIIKKRGGNGGGSSSSAYTVTFKAGDNGKITAGKSSVSVDKDAKLAASDVPTVTANDGYKFVGWSLDGENVVDPTKDAVTKSVTYTALYQEAKGGHDAYMFGYADGTFQPNAQITRAEAAALIARLNPEYDLTADYTGNLSDVVADAWYTNVINFNVEKGFITGYPDGTFKPNNSITRQEFCTIVAKYLGLENTGEANFSDTKGVYAEGYIAQLVEKNIVSGYSDGTFKPDANITRAEATKILNGVFDRVPNKETVDAHIAEYTVNLKDVPATHWAYYEILEAALDHTPADFHK